MAKQRNPPASNDAAARLERAQELARRARIIGATPGTSDEVVRDALWWVVDALLEGEPRSAVQFWIGDQVRHVTDPQGRPRGTVVRPPDVHNYVKVRWFGGHEPDDWEENVHKDELQLRVK